MATKKKTAKKAAKPAKKTTSKRKPAKPVYTKKTAACPICKTEQRVTRVGVQDCTTCPARLIVQDDFDGKSYFTAKTEFTTTGKIDPDNNDQPVEVHWIQNYPMVKDLADVMDQDTSLFLDRTLFFIDTKKNKSIAYAEHSFNGYVSVERFQRLVANHLV